MPPSLMAASGTPLPTWGTSSGICSPPSQSGALAALLDHAARHVPRYHGLPLELEAFPVSTKRTILADLKSQLSLELGGDRDPLAAFLADENRRRDGKYESIFNSRIVVEETSGSSGIPFAIPKTVQERARVAFGLWRYRRRFDPQASVANFYPFIHEPANFRSLGNPYDLRPGNVNKLYARLGAAGIRWVHGEPRLLRWHAETISADTTPGHSVRFAESSGQRVSREDRQVIESGLGVKLVDQYGSREAWAMGIRDHDGAFEVLRDNVVIELIDPSGSAVTQPLLSGRVTVTCLHQRVLPFIRYDTGDLGMWEPDGVGRSLRLLPMREHNLLRLSDGEINGNEFFKDMLFLVYNEIGQIHLRYVQVRQLGPGKFVLATSRSPRAPQLCEALGRRCCTSVIPFPRQAIFTLRQLDDAEVERELQGKQSLFTTKFMSAG